MPELVPIRYGRMLSSPFAFYRGAAAIMAADLAATPRTGLRRRSVRRCAPARTSASSPRPSATSSSTSTTSTRRCPARGSGTSSASPRASSIAGRERAVLDASERERDACSRPSSAYRERHARRFAGDARNLDVWYARVDVDDARQRAAPPSVDAQHAQVGREGCVAKARTQDSLQALRQADAHRRRAAAHRRRPAADRAARRTRRRRARDDRSTGCAAWSDALPAARCPTTGACSSTATSWSTSRARSSASAASARRPGSCCCSAATTSDPLFLQVKEAQASVLEAFLGPSRYAQRTASASSTASG